MSQTSVTAGRRPENTVFAVILAVSVCHFINDVIQSLLVAVYPLLKLNYKLDFWQIGLLTMAFQGTASVLQPLIGLYADKRPLYYLLPAAMGFTCVGLMVFAFASQYGVLVLGAMLVGLGSAIIHPESSRVARLASGGRYGLAQSLFQVGGNLGASMGPLVAAFIVMPLGQASISWFTAATFVGMVILWQVGNWYARYQANAERRPSPQREFTIPRRKVAIALIVLTILTFSKNIYLASLSSYYTFYVIDRFSVSVEMSQVLLFVFLGAAAAGTVLGGPIGDKLGAKVVIWISILGILPFTLALPYANLEWTIVLTAIIGLILASAFPAIVVMAQELIPGRVGMVAGIFFGLAFGIAGIAAALLGVVADVKGIRYVYWLCSFLPLLGLLTVFLPNTGQGRMSRRVT
ncbi:MFS transporter [Chelativorans sp. Marseille-P2723]|uniref:MFS transporter n=1 Tax=Chelativorans sp. Marseille-P2723 TaxID=2709133 RepID=UPI00156DD4FE|nr:MFS transporter [Chelativorans sp. Marseille-P2723]